MKKIKITSLSLLGAFWLFPSIYKTLLSYPYDGKMYVISWRQNFIATFVSIGQIATDLEHTPTYYFVFLIASLVAIVLLIACLILSKKEVLSNKLLCSSFTATLIVLLSYITEIQMISSITNFWGVLMLIVPHLFYVASVVLFVIYVFNIHRRPSKEERLQAQIDELQKQVDELKKGD